ncbi:MAG: hypothetical protein WB797_03930 [Nocardioides sp.]
MDESARRDEADLLAQIGRSLFAQDLRVRVQLPAALATGALAAWKRDDTGDSETETETECTIRSQSGALALIGLAVDERGVPSGSDQVGVELDAWQIGSALDAADERGLLAGLESPWRDT